MTRVFIDTGAFFAVTITSDPFHQRAKDLFETAFDEQWELFTSNAVVIETHALFVNRALNGSKVGIRFLEDIASGFCEVERITPVDEQWALSFLRSRPQTGYSYCDALSFSVIRRLRIRHALSFDRHFRSYSPITVL